MQESDLGSVIVSILLDETFMHRRITEEEGRERASMMDAPKTFSLVSPISSGLPLLQFVYSQ